MLYESKHSFNTDLFKIETGTDFSFPKHLHGSFEYITVTEGEMTVSVGECDYTLKNGQSLLIFPNQVHSLKTEKHSSHFLCIFAPKLISAYSSVYLTKLPKSNIFEPSESTRNAVFSFSESSGVGKLRLKGILYSLCADFDSTAEYVEHDGERYGLLEKIFGFVESEYNKDCSLDALSAATSYHYVYLSRYFKKCTGLSFTEYVNTYRVNEACYLLRNGEQSILETAFNCGYDSLRSFNRNFKKIMQITPVEYRAQA
ncbi:MAG: AraC family transcriptional regulator [Clostridia bacterium]|nr:AraC family transcriptional regulator [Clostridia bacterium]